MDDQKPSWLELECILPLKSSKGARDAEQICGICADTIKSRFPQFIKRLSARRVGIKLRHALEIANGLK